MVLSDNQRCFCCGADNPIGLKLQFWFDGEDYCTQFTPAEVHQGYEGWLHGGILATVLDEVMARLLWVTGRKYVTAEINVRFRYPVGVGEALTVRGRVARVRERLIEMTAEASNVRGHIVGEAEAKFVRP